MYTLYTKEQRAIMKNGIRRRYNEVQMSFVLTAIKVFKQDSLKQVKKKAVE